MAASALSLVAAQRLVRRNCRHCLVEYEPSEEVLFALGLASAVSSRQAPVRFVRGTGCASCKGRGYWKRVALVEMMPLSTRLREQIAQNRPAGEIRHEAVDAGMRTLREDGVAKALQGITTVEEVLRVCMSDE